MYEQAVTLLRKRAVTKKTLALELEVSLMTAGRYIERIKADRSLGRLERWKIREGERGPFSIAYQLVPR